MYKQLVLSFLTICLVVSCLSPQQNETIEYSGDLTMNDAMEAFSSQEWLSFQIECSTHPKRGKGWVNCTKTFIVYSPQNGDGYVVCMDKDHATFITKDSIACIHNEYQEITVVYNKPEGNPCYDFIMVNEIDSYFTLAGLYASLVKDYTHADWSETKRFERANGKRVVLPGEITMKACSETECHIFKDTVSFYYNLEKQCVDSLVYCPQGDYHICQVLSNLSMNDQTELVDSIFNLSSARYCHYYVQRGDSVWSNYSSDCGNYEMNDSVLNASLISVARLDTLRIKDLRGWTLLCIWRGFGGFLDVSTQSLENRRLRKVLDNTLFVMPYCENFELARRQPKYEENKNNVYCSRHFNYCLSPQYNYYLISPKKEIVYKSMANVLGLKERTEIMYIIKHYNTK